MTGELHSSTPPPLPPTTEDERLSWLRLLRSRRVGIATFYRLLADHGTASAALEALPEIAAEEASEFARQLECSIRNVAFRSGGQTTAIFHSVRSVSAQLQQQVTLAEMMAGLNRQLDESSRQAA